MICGAVGRGGVERCWVMGEFLRKGTEGTESGDRREKWCGGAFWGGSFGGAEQRCGSCCYEEDGEIVEALSEASSGLRGILEAEIAGCDVTGRRPATAWRPYLGRIGGRARRAGPT